MTPEEKTDITHLELHRAPLRWLAVPARIHVIGYKQGDDDRESIKQRFLELAQDFELSENNIVWHNDNAFARSGQKDLILKLDIQANHYTFQVWTKPAQKAKIDFAEIPDCPQDRNFNTGNKLTELDILLGADDLTTRLPELLPGVDTLGSRILDGKINVATNYQPDDRGRERYLIYPAGGKIDGDQAEFIVDNVVRLENNFHLLSLPRSVYAAANDRLRLIENAGSKELETIGAALSTAGTNTLKGWLNDLTAGFTELAKMTEEFNRHFADAVIYKDVLRTIFADFREKPLEGFAPLSAPILRSTTGISADYARLISRIDSVRKQKSGIISILRTKIDLIQRDQSFALQCSMHETTKAQMSMQQTIEGLYVFIVAFYLTELARIVFESLKERGWVSYSSNTMAAAFIPIAILAGLLLSGKAKHWREKLKRRQVVPGRMLKTPELGLGEEDG